MKIKLAEIEEHAFTKKMCDYLFEIARNILTTKLFIPPPRTSLVSLPRLVDLLNQGLNKKLILISAPAGFGKTTLLSEWISQSKLSFCWLSLDEQINDLLQSIAYVVAALKSIQIEINEQILDLSPSQQVEDSTTLLISLINQISADGRDFCLVLDDYHLIQNQQIHEAVTYILENLPPGDAPLRLAQLLTRGVFCEIRRLERRSA